MSSKNICDAADVASLNTNTAMLVANDGVLGKHQVADVVVEQGTSGIWTYRKWASGIAECWGTSSGTFDINTAWGNIYYSAGQYEYESYPFTFINKPVCTYSIENSGSFSVWVMTAGTVGSTTQTPVLQFSRGATGTGVSIETHWHVIGRWK